MTERVNLVDAYDNRSVVAKLVSMEERISGAETSVEASAEAAATSASKAAVSQTAAKTSEANAKASADTAASILSSTVDLSSKQTITGAKTFAGDTTVTGQLISSGTNTLSGTTELEGTVELDSTAVATLNGKVTASNTGNSLKVANHDTALMSNDVLSAKDINTPNGDANNLLHRSGDETLSGVKTISGELIVTGKLNLTYGSTVSDADGKWVAVAKWDGGVSNQSTAILITAVKPAIFTAMGLLIIGGNFDTGTPICKGVHINLSGKVAVAVDNTNTGYLLFKSGGNNALAFSKLMDSNWGTLSNRFTGIDHVAYDTLDAFKYSAVLE